MEESCGTVAAINLLKVGEIVDRIETLEQEFESLPGYPWSTSGANPASFSVGPS